MERTIIKSGYVVMTDAICGGSTILHKISSEEDANIMHPEFYLTESDAWKDIAEDMIEDLQQFINVKETLKIRILVLNYIRLIASYMMMIVLL